MGLDAERQPASGWAALPKPKVAYAYRFGKRPDGPTFTPKGTKVGLVPPRGASSKGVRNRRFGRA